jgi:hypothetical protein
MRCQATAISVTANIEPMTEIELASRSAQFTSGPSWCSTTDAP